MSHFLQAPCWLQRLSGTLMTQLVKATNKAWWSLSSSNPRTLLSSWPWTLHLDTHTWTEQIIITWTLNGLVAAAEYWNPSTRVLLGRVVDVDVLQQFGSEAVVGMRAGQNLQDSAVVWTQEHHCPVLVGAGRHVHHNLGQLGPASKKKDAQWSVRNIKPVNL